MSVVGDLADVVSHDEAVLVTHHGLTVVVLFVATAGSLHDAGTSSDENGYYVDAYGNTSVRLSHDKNSV